MISVDLKILDSRLSLQLPAYATAGSAAMDLCACIPEPLVVQPAQTVLIPSGLAMHLDQSRYAALILPRSGLGHKHGMVLGNLVGLIDSDYQGEIRLSMWNRGENAYTIHPLERIAQLMIIPVERVQWRVVEEFTQSLRGEGGFGSTGQH